MALSIRDENTGEIKTWVWAVVALGVVGVVFVLFRGGGGSASNAGSTEGQSSDLTQTLADLQKAILELQKGTSNVPKDSHPAVKPRKNPTDPADPTKPIEIIQWFDLAKGTKFYDRISGKIAGTIQQKQHVQVSKAVINGTTWYRILSGPRRGEWFKV